MVDSLNEKLIGKKIALDIDGLLACFTCAVKARAKTMGYDFPTCQTVTYWDISDKFSEIMEEAWLDENFWLNLSPLTTPNKITFKVDSYITHRPISAEVTKKWLQSHGFPEAEVISVKESNDKLGVIKERGIDIFVDDYYKTIKHLRDNGVNALLFYSPYQGGHYEECKDLPTIRSLDQIEEYV